MGEASSIIGFIIIVILYIVIGIMAAAGSMFISQRIFAPKAEQIFYGLFLIRSPGFIWLSRSTLELKQRGYWNRQPYWRLLQ